MASPHCLDAMASSTLHHQHHLHQPSSPPTATATTTTASSYASSATSATFYTNNHTSSTTSPTFMRMRCPSSSSSSINSLNSMASNNCCRTSNNPWAHPNPNSPTLIPSAPSSSTSSSPRASPPTLHLLPQMPSSSFSSSAFQAHSSHIQHQPSFKKQPTRSRSLSPSPSIASTVSSSSTVFHFQSSSSHFTTSSTRRHSHHPSFSYFSHNGATLANSQEDEDDRHNSFKGPGRWGQPFGAARPLRREGSVCSIDSQESGCSTFVGVMLGVGSTGMGGKDHLYEATLSSAATMTTSATQVEESATATDGVMPMESAPTVPPKDDIQKHETSPSPEKDKFQYPPLSIPHTKTTLHATADHIWASPYWTPSTTSTSTSLTLIPKQPQPNFNTFKKPQNLTTLLITTLAQGMYRATLLTCTLYVFGMSYVVVVAVKVVLGVGNVCVPVLVEGVKKVGGGVVRVVGGVVRVGVEVGGKVAGRVGEVYGVYGDPLLNKVLDTCAPLALEGISYVRRHRAMKFLMRELDRRFTSRFGGSGVWGGEGEGPFSAFFCEEDEDEEVVVGGVRGDGCASPCGVEEVKEEGGSGNWDGEGAAGKGGKGEEVKKEKRGGKGKSKQRYRQRRTGSLGCGPTRGRRNNASGSSGRRGRSLGGGGKRDGVAGERVRLPAWGEEVMSVEDRKGMERLLRRLDGEREEEGFEESSLEDIVVEEGAEVEVEVKKEEEMRKEEEVKEEPVVEESAPPKSTKPEMNSGSSKALPRRGVVGWSIGVVRSVLGGWSFTSPRK
ncbi:hypothetical protein HDU97_008942 [Phlyctochytrium planicorne]|nr:hypothetical protein HDU97_008942 [Phlyctochytrium planicorne]